MFTLTKVLLTDIVTYKFHKLNRGEEINKNILLWRMKKMSTITLQLISNIKESNEQIIQMNLWHN